MFPPIKDTILTSDVDAIVDGRIGLHGEISQTEQRPYIVCQLVTGNAYDNLTDAPCGDFTTVQIDCYAKDQRTLQNLALAVRDALDAQLIVNRVVVNLRDAETRLYRVGMEADFITRR